MKSYTDIKQSAQLALLLPAESADMWWSKNFIYYNPTASIGIGTEYNDVYTYKFGEDDIPCWSLSALLDVMQEPELIKNSNGTWLIRVWYNRYPFSRGGYNNPVDACYEMILKLHEQNLL